MGSEAKVIKVKVIFKSETGYEIAHTEVEFPLAEIQENDTLEVEIPIWTIQKVLDFMDMPPAMRNSK